MISVLHIISSLTTGGAEMNLYRLISQTENHGFQNCVVSMSNLTEPIGSKLQSHGVDVYSLDMRRNKVDIRGIWQLLSIINKHKPHIIHTWMYHANILGTIVWLLTRHTSLVWGIRHTFTNYSDYSWNTAMTIRLGAKLSHLPNTILFNSNTSLHVHVKAGYSGTRMQVISNGIDTELFQPNSSIRSQFRTDLGIDNETIVIGMVARYNLFKGCDTFIAAAGVLSQLHTNVIFLLVGHGLSNENEELVNLIRQHSSPSRFLLLGERGDISKLINVFDISTSSSYSEGFPTTVIESMACGVPCIVTDVGDSARIVGNTGIVIPCRNPEALADGWNKILLLDAEERHKLGKLARQRVQDNFSLQNVVYQYQSLYENLLRNSG